MLTKMLLSGVRRVFKNASTKITYKTRWIGINSLPKTRKSMNLGGG